MPYTSVTLSSAATLSSVANMDWIGGYPASISVTTNSSVGTGDFIIQYTLSDVQRTPSSLVAWSGFSSVAFNSPVVATGTHYTSSTIWPDGIAIFAPGPLAAVRLNSTALSSNTLTLRVLQGGG